MSITTSSLSISSPLEGANSPSRSLPPLQEKDHKILTVFQAVGVEYLWSNRVAEPFVQKWEKWKESRSQGVLGRPPHPLPLPLHQVALRYLQLMERSIRNSKKVVRMEKIPAMRCVRMEPSPLASNHVVGSQLPFRLLADRKIEKGNMVIEFVGELRLVAEEEKSEKPSREPYCFYFEMAVNDQGEGASSRSSYWMIDAKKSGNAARFIGHSAMPNLASLLLFPDEVEGNVSLKKFPHLLYFALREIQPGEELSVDYAKAPHRSWSEFPLELPFRGGEPPRSSPSNSSALLLEERHCSSKRVKVDEVPLAPLQLEDEAPLLPKRQKTKSLVPSEEMGIELASMPPDEAFQVKAFLLGARFSQLVYSKSEAPSAFDHFAAQLEAFPYFDSHEEVSALRGHLYAAHAKRLLSQQNSSLGDLEKAKALLDASLTKETHPLKEEVNSLLQQAEERFFQVKIRGFEESLKKLEADSKMPREAQKTADRLIGSLTESISVLKQTPLLSEKGKQKLRVQALGVMGRAAQVSRKVADRLDDAKLNLHNL